MGVSISVDLGEAKKLLSGVKDLTENQLQRLLYDVGETVLAAEVRASVIGQRSEKRSYKYGRFLTSIQTRPKAGGMVEVFSDVDYAVFLEFGTNAHWIEPVNAQALHWKVGGEDFFSKGHMVKGIEPRRHFRNSLNRVEPRMREHFRNLLKAEIDKL